MRTKYNIFIFISTITRNIIDIYSVIYLYNKGISIDNIIIIYTNCYFLGSIISYLSIVIGNHIGYKYILWLSSIITGVTFYIMNKTINIYLISLFISLSMFTYHPIRHYFGVCLLKEKRKVGNSLIYIYIASLLASYIAISNISNMYLLFVSFMEIIPTSFIKKEKYIKIEYPNINSKQQLKFFFFDQFKIIFILLEPLYLYLITSNITYVGIFNIILTISSIICIYLLTNKIDIYKVYPYINIIFTIILYLKLNIINKNILLIIAFMEGIGIKTNELVSTLNMYQTNNNNPGYIILVEFIFCMTRALILSISYFILRDLKVILYVMLIGVFELSFHYKKNTI